MNHVAAIKNADQKIFVEVYDQLYQKVYFFFLKRTRLQETAKELCQQSFIKLWQSRHSLSDEHPIDIQCFTIANSVLVDHLRKQAIERKHNDERYSQTNNSLSVASDPVKHFESTDYLKVAASKLPPVRRNVFILKIIQGYSNKEIAQQLSISVKTVEDHYSKAVRHIRSVS